MLGVFLTFGANCTEMSEYRRETMPEDVRIIVLREQTREKEKRGINQFSITSTIYKIIREWEKCYNSQKDKK